jgi:hypothetical protein
LRIALYFISEAFVKARRNKTARKGEIKEGRTAVAPTPLRVGWFLLD